MWCELYHCAFIHITTPRTRLFCRICAQSKCTKPYGLTIDGLPQIQSIPNLKRERGRDRYTGWNLHPTERIYRYNMKMIDDHHHNEIIATNAKRFFRWSHRTSVQWMRIGVANNYYLQSAAMKWGNCWDHKKRCFQLLAKLCLCFDCNQS